jgi:hypothetical protein
MTQAEIRNELTEIKERLRKLGHAASYTYDGPQADGLRHFYRGKMQAHIEAAWEHVISATAIANYPIESEVKETADEQAS